jgi:hypothetical protein
MASKGISAPSVLQPSQDSNQPLGFVQATILGMRIVRKLTLYTVIDCLTAVSSGYLPDSYAVLVVDSLGPRPRGRQDMPSREVAFRDPRAPRMEHIPHGQSP